MDKLFLFDAYALIYRSYYAFIKNPRINSKGLNTSAVMGFCNTLHEVLTKENPHIWELPSTPTALPSAPRPTPNIKRRERRRPRTYAALCPS